MKNVFANLIAIDNYPNPDDRLSGCTNDLGNVRNLLEWEYAQHSTLNVECHQLIDGSATREAIIDGFRFYNDAKDGDVCLLYFCGHGSRIKSPPFITNKDGRNQTLISYDSRPDGQNELIDKELAFLIRQVTLEKDLHFVVIMDCCHSGSNSRSKHFKIRGLQENPLARPLESYLGFTSYEQVNLAGQSAYKSIPGPHIHLAAAKEFQTAKELSFEGRIRGAFTYFLCQTLAEAGPNISYGNLINKVSLRLQQEVSRQSPGVECVNADPQLINTSFLGLSPDAIRRVYSVSYQPPHWVLSAGKIHGISIGDRVICDSNKEWEFALQSVQPTTSLLETAASDLLDDSRIFDIHLKKAYPKLFLAFMPGVRDKLRLAWAERLEALADVTITQDDTCATFFIGEIKNHLALFERDQRTTVFKPVDVSHEGSILYFTNLIERLASWMHVSTLSNPTSSILEEELGCKLFQVTEPGNLADDAPVTALSPAISSHQLSYLSKNGQSYEPAIKLSITNNSIRPLWVSVLYLGSGLDQATQSVTRFSVSNRFLPMERLMPGNKQWILDHMDGRSYLTIPLRIEKELIDAGEHNQQMMFKIMVSTHEFNTDIFNHEGLPLAPKNMRQRPSSSGRHWSAPDWRSFEIPINVIYNR